MGRGGKRLLSLLVPPLCAACGRACEAGEVACGDCRRSLARLEPLRGKGPQGIDAAWSSAPHEGPARDLVSALKFRRLEPVAGAIAARIAALAPNPLLSGVLVPVPTARRRTMARGFDPAAALAAELAILTGMRVDACLRRTGSGRQVGRRRAERLSAPPRVSAPAGAPASAVLVDDVLTTGATISACALALRRAGSRRVVAVTFCRRL